MDLRATQTNTKTTQTNTRTTQTNTETTQTNKNNNNGNGNGKGKTPVSHQTQIYNEEIDSSCSTPYVSAPSSPSRIYNNGFFYSAPASPMHFTISSSKIPISISSSCDPSSTMSGLDFEFDFSSRLFPNNDESSANNGSMSSADELFLNGQIRPMKLSSHLQRPQRLAPLIDLDFENEDDEIGSEDNGLNKVELLRGRDLRNRTSSLRRRTRSLSPLRNSPPYIWPKHGFEFDNENEKPSEFHLGDEKNQNGDLGNEENEEKQNENENRACSVSGSGSSSRSSSAGRSSKRWVFLKEFLYRSKSEGRSSSVKFWSPVAKEKKPISSNDSKPMENNVKKSGGGRVVINGKPVNGVGKRRVPPPSPHELHYTANRAQAEEMRKKTFLPYKQGLLGCLGFSSKGYGAMNGFARALNPVSSR